MKYDDPEYEAIINEIGEFDAHCKEHYAKYKKHLAEIEKLKIRADDCFASAVFCDNEKKKAIQKKFAYERSKNE